MPIDPTDCTQTTPPITIHMVPLGAHGVMWMLTLLAILFMCLLMPGEK